MHVPVLLQEVLSALGVRPGGLFLDGTLGAGGYSQALLDASAPDGVVVALDLDEGAVERATARFASLGDRFHAVHRGFHEAGAVLESLGLGPLDGAVLDLGLSSDQLEDPERGFSFQEEGPLDMRFDRDSGEPLSRMLARIREKELAHIIAEYGQERYSRRVARRIVAAMREGRIKTTLDLARTVRGAIPRGKGRIHPATRTFQALRIAVNRELEHLDEALRTIPRLLGPGGRFCVVSYHSLEDGRVKRAFRELAWESGWVVLTPKPVRPSEDEVRSNPRARSARLRTLERSI